MHSINVLMTYIALTTFTKTGGIEIVKNKKVSYSSTSSIFKYVTYEVIHILLQSLKSIFLFQDNGNYTIELLSGITKTTSLVRKIID